LTRTRASVAPAFPLYQTRPTTATVNIGLPAPIEKVPVITASNDHHMSPGYGLANSQCEKTDLPAVGNNVIAQ
jgi:hypothetical protein